MRIYIALLTAVPSRHIGPSMAKSLTPCSRSQPSGVKKPTGLAEEKCSLDQLLAESSGSAFYECDFGDSWLHRLTMGFPPVCGPSASLRSGIDRKSARDLLAPLGEAVVGLRPRPLVAFACHKSPADVPSNFPFSGSRKAHHGRTVVRGGGVRAVRDLPGYSLRAASPALSNDAGSTLWSTSMSSSFTNSSAASSSIAASLSKPLTAG